ncbi:uncharacterized protein LOC115309781 [Ixodes scapularis]|uniref:uncharacterized protein LOC115309781 n=1 Tax=Ixodes scapularis TaxID=6945 RepID=UPI001A9E720A|nr:uncharacterized protein LOC115309781 [Ixodes scapularis]
MPCEWQGDCVAKFHGFVVTAVEALRYVNSFDARLVGNEHQVKKVWCTVVGRIRWLLACLGQASGAHSLKKDVVGTVTRDWVPVRKPVNVRVEVAEKNNTIFMLTETWLDASVHGGELLGTAHAIYRRDRGGRWGGVLVAVPNGITADRRHDLEHPDLEAIFLDLYTPQAGLLQVCHSPTYLPWSSFLDLVFTTDITKVLSCDVYPGLSGSDHMAVEVSFATSLPRKGHFARTTWRFYETDHSHLANLAHLAPWCMTTAGRDCLSNFDLGCDFASAIQRESIPHSLRSTRRKRAPWITCEIIKAANQKRAHFKKAARLQCAETLRAAKDLQRTLKAAIHTSHISYARNVALKAREDPKLFWSYMSKLQTSSNKLTFVNNNVPLTSPRDIAQSLTPHFASVFNVGTLTPDIDHLVQNIEENTPCHSLLMPDITPSLEHLHEVFRQIMPSLSPGPDNFPPAFLRLLCPQVSPSLLSIFQSFLDTAAVPDLWKRALVTPIHKGKGKPVNDVSSYRPVSVTSILCRTFERMLNRTLLDYLSVNNILSSSQHGFRPGRSCETALATITHYISDALDDHTSTDLIQLDYSNAFDTLDHHLLLQKLTGLLPNTND